MLEILHCASNYIREELISNERPKDNYELKMLNFCGCGFRPLLRRQTPVPSRFTFTQSVRLYRMLHQVWTVTVETAWACFKVTLVRTALRGIM